jgi:radical SAM superfamily enzyme YgiQ (UPF0313 family)
LEKNNTVILIYPRLVEGNQPKKGPPPLSVLSLSNLLKNRGKKVQLYDLRSYDNYEALLKSIPEAPICFGVSVKISNQIRDGAFFSELAHQIFPGVPVVWGGWFPSMLPHIAISHPAIDIVVRGRGEITFVELVETISGGGNLSEIKGITYKKDGTIFNNPPREPIDLNSLPPVDYSIVDISRSTLSDGITIYASSIGCFNRCKFCNIHLNFGRKWMSLSPERVLNDIENLIKDYNVQIIDFCDANFFARKQRVREIMHGLIKRRLKISWTANCRVDQFLQLNEEDIRLIKRGGCHLLSFGAESGNQKTLDFLHKDIRVKQIEEVAKLSYKHNLLICYCFIVGAPNETPHDFQKTLKFILKLKKIHPESKIVIYYYMPLPESELKEEDIKMGFKQPDTFEGWSRYVVGDISQPWIFHVDKSIIEDKRESFRCMSYYFWRGYLVPSANFVSLPQYFKSKVLKALCRVRIQTGFYAFPVEWKLFRHIHSS